MVECGYMSWEKHGDRAWNVVEYFFAWPGLKPRVPFWRSSCGKIAET